MESKGSISPRNFSNTIYLDIHDDLPEATIQDSFQRRMELIFRKYGIGVLLEPEQVLHFLEDSDIEQKTKKISRTILMSDAVEWLIS